MKAMQKKLPLILLIILVGFPQISETIYTPALPNVAQGLIASASKVEATLTFYFLGFALGILIWGMISDSIGRRPAMLAGLFIYGLATLFCANVGNINSLLLWRFLQAFGSSVGSVITQTMLRDFYDEKERTKLFAIMSGALAFSPALGPLLGGFISEYLGWRANFATLTILAVVLIIWSLLTLPETRSTKTPPSINKISILFRLMIRSRPLWGHILLISATNGILFGFYQEAPFVFIEQLGMKPSHYGFFGILIAAATILAARVSYKQSHRFSSQQLIVWGATSVFIGSILFTLTVFTRIFNLTPIGMSTSIATLLLIFFGIGLIIPNSLSHALRAYKTEIGTAGSIFGGCYYSLIAGFTSIMTLLHNGTPLPLSLYSAILGLILIWGSQMIGFVNQDSDGKSKKIKI